MSSQPLIAAFSDVHGNAIALEAVLKDIRSFAPDLILNLGDQVWGQVDPLAAAEMQAAIGAVEVRGNNDEKPLLEPGVLSEFEDRYRDWLEKRVDKVHFERLAALPVSRTVGDGSILAAHGTPTSPWELFLWQLAAGGMVPRDEHDLASETESLDRGVELVLVGHTHQERSVTVGGRLLVNVGPVAWQRDGDPRARWTLLRHGPGGWTAELRRVDYDWEAAAAAVLANDPVHPAEAEAHLYGLNRRPNGLVSRRR